MQYLNFLGGVIKGDFGNSFFGGTPVWTLIAQALPATLLLSSCRWSFPLLISIPLGIRAAVKAGSWSDQIIRILLADRAFLPEFLAGNHAGADLLDQIGMAAVERLPRLSGYRAALLDAGTHPVLPSMSASCARQCSKRLSTQYILVSRAKGLKDRVVLYKHALRNCLIPLLTFVGLQFGDLLGGVVIVERVFNWPGMGSLAFDAISARDYPVLQGTITVLALMIVLTTSCNRSCLRHHRSPYRKEVTDRATSSAKRASLSPYTVGADLRHCLYRQHGRAGRVLRRDLSRYGGHDGSARLDCCRPSSA